MKRIIQWTLILFALSCPIWLPLLEGYLFSVYRVMVEKPEVSTVESTNFVVVLTAFIVGNVSFGILCARYFSLFILPFYTAGSIIVLFLTGWSALLMVGYGN